MYQRVVLHLPFAWKINLVKENNILLTRGWAGCPGVFRSKAPDIQWPDIRWVGEILCASVEDVSVVSKRERTALRRNDWTGSIDLTFGNKNKVIFQT